MGYLLKINNLLLIAMLALLSGCIPLAIGAGAGAGYVAANENRDSATIAEDNRITAGIKKEYADDLELSHADIDVDTYRGVVTLRGHVKDSYLKDRAVADAWGTSGVKEVTSKLFAP